MGYEDWDKVIGGSAVSLQDGFGRCWLDAVDTAFESNSARSGDCGEVGGWCSNMNMESQCIKLDQEHTA